MLTTLDHSRAVDVTLAAGGAASSAGEISQALASLAPPLREILVLRECRGWGYEQIAQTLNLSRSVVHQRIADARKEMLRLI